MNRIKVKVLNPDAVADSEKMLVCSARLTQRGHKIKTMADFEALLAKPYDRSIIESLTSLPHPAIQKFGLYNVAVIGASRRFLAQITRHQNEVKFMSSSLQYSDYSEDADFVVPYELMEHGRLDDYTRTCSSAMDEYASFIDDGVSGDSAGYLTPESLRIALIISATPFQWKHMISQRTCRRNTDETRYVMLRIWEAFNEISPDMLIGAGPACVTGGCKEGKMRCANGAIVTRNPTEIVETDFPLLTNKSDRSGARSDDNAIFG